MKIISLIKTYDFLGPEMTFRINNHENFKTVFGGVFSLISYALFLCFFIIFGMDFFNKQNPKVVTQFITPLNEENTTFTFYKDFHLAFRIVSEDNKIIPINMNNTNDILLNYQTFENSKLSKNINLPLKRCSNKDFPYKINENASDYICANFTNTNITLAGGWHNINDFFGILMLSIKFNPFLFQNYSENNTNLNDYSDFIQKYQYVQLIVPQAVFNPNDYSNPLNLQPKYISACLTKFSGMVDQIFLRDHKVETDEGIFTENIERINKVAFNEKLNYFYFINKTESDAEYYAEIYFDKTYNFSTRQYMKFQDLLGNISGFMDMIYFVFSILISLNSDYRFNKLIVNKMAYIIEPEEINNLNRNTMREVNKLLDKNNKIEQLNSPLEPINYLKEMKTYTIVDDKQSVLSNLNLYSNKNLIQSAILDKNNINNPNIEINN